MFEPEMSFANIAPRWHSRLQNFPAPILSLRDVSWGIQIALPDTCVIGEAYGYTGDYIGKCTDCEKIGYEFVRSYFVRSHSRLLANIEQFTSHWNKSHANITKKHKPLPLLQSAAQFVSRQI